MRVKLNRKTSKLVAGAVLAVVLLAGLYFLLQAIDRSLAEKANVDAAQPSAEQLPPLDAVYQDGVRYLPKDRLTSVLIIGVDDFGTPVESGSYLNTGQADMLSLLVFDNAEKAYTVVQLDRDTMAEIPVLGVGGKRAGSITGQLALAHTYGSGLTDSAENTVAAVSDFLMGVEIDSYIAVTMDAVAAVNDLVGGVVVEIKDDFSGVDASLVQGETVLLKGEQALSYVRARGGMKDATNAARMTRQKEYIAALSDRVRAKMAENSGFAVDIYNSVYTYMVSDLTLTAFSDMAERLADYAHLGTFSPKGEHRVGEFTEFYADADALRELILNVFYTAG